MDFEGSLLVSELLLMLPVYRRSAQSLTGPVHITKQSEEPNHVLIKVSCQVLHVSHINDKNWNTCVPSFQIFKYKFDHFTEWFWSNLIFLDMVFIMQKISSGDLAISLAKGNLPWKEIQRSWGRKDARVSKDRTTVRSGVRHKPVGKEQAKPEEWEGHGAENGTLMGRQT